MIRVPHAEVHLPPLTADEALVIVDVFECLIMAVWRAHGPAMAARLDEIYDGRAARCLRLLAPPLSDDIPF
jgi:hypothetical protein